MTDNRFPRPLALLRNALTWGAAWATAGGGLAAAGTFLNPSLVVENPIGRLAVSLLAGIAWGVRFGLAGAVVGAVFSTVVRLSYLNRRLAEINPARFTVLGAVVGGAAVPLYLQIMNVLSGGRPIAWGLVLDDALMGTLFGAATAGASILLARRADAQHGAPDRLQSSHRLHGLRAAGARESWESRHARSDLHGEESPLR